MDGFFVKAGVVNFRVYGLTSLDHVPSDSAFAPLADHGEAAIGQAMAWPRLKRDGMLLASDWTQQADAPLAPGAKSAWASYRQTLRDLPAVSQNPLAVTWPATPAAST